MHLAPKLALALLRFTGTAILAVVVIVSSLMLGIRYIVFPQLDDYRGRIVAELSKQLGQPVAIDAIAGGWDGWNPKLAISGLAIHDRARPQAAPVLLLPRVDLVIAWTSLIAMDLRLKVLQIERPQLSLRRDAKGFLHIAGFEIDPEAQGDDTRFTDWFLRQPQIVVNDALLSWTDELYNAPVLVLDHVMFRVEQTFGRHRFGLVGSPPADLASPLDFRGELEGTSFKDWRDARGRFYLRLDYADLAAWRQWIPVMSPLATGKGAVRIWAGFAGGKATDVVADLELTGVRGRVARNLPELDLAHLGGHITWTSGGGKNELTTRGLTFRTPDGQALAPAAISLVMNEDAAGTITGGQLAFDRIDVAPLSTLGEHLPLPPEWRRDLALLALRGSVTNGKFAWTGPADAPTRYSGSGAFTRFGIAANEALPGAASVSGNFTFDEKRGDLKLDSRDMRVTIPRIFSDTLNFETASGRVGWTKEPDGLRIAIEDVRFATPHTSGTASGSWHAREQGPGTIELKAQLARADAKNLYNYLPLTLSSGVRDWLRGAIKEGQASEIKMALAGDLGDFPFPDPRKGQFLVTFKAAGVTLDYAEGWPAVTNLDADVRFEGTGMTIEARRGTILGAQAGPVKAEIPHLGHPVLSIVGEASGPTSAFLEFVDKSPVAGWIDHATAGAEATGNGKLDLKFSLPLANAEAFKVAGEFQLLNNSLTIPAVPPLSQMNGHLVFSEADISSRDLVAEVFGGPAKITLGSEEGHARITASGTTNLASIKKEFDVPLLQRISGSTDWQLVAQARPQGTTWTLESSMKGALVELPAPIGKAAAEAAPLKVERRPLSASDELLTVDYRGEMRLLAHRTLGKASSDVDRALLLLGPAAGRGGVADRQGLWVRGQIADFDLDEWLALYDKEFGKPTAQPPAKSASPFQLGGVDIEVGRLDVFGRVLHDLKATATRSESEWRLRLAGKEVEGTAAWRGPAPGIPNGRIMARLSRLVPPGPDELHPVHSEVDASSKAKNTWPELDIAADAFVTRTGHDIGKLELLAQPSGPDWRISKLSLTNSAGRIDADGWWRFGREKQTTEIDVSLDAEDAGVFLDRFGYPVAVRNTPTKITGKLMWNGAPNDFDYPSLTGTFAMQTGAGQFTKIDPGIGKLLGVLSLQALPRRITLDFRDVFSEGFAFDDITGDFKVQQGVMRTDNLAIEGPAASVKLTGEIDLARETQKLDVRVKPALSSTFSAGAAVLFIANPIVGAVVGAGTLLAQKLLDNPLGQMFSYDYRVTGSWSDPQVARVDQRAIPNSATAGSATK